MKKLFTILFTIILLLPVVLFSQTALAADTCASLNGLCFDALAAGKNAQASCTYFTNDNPNIKASQSYSDCKSPKVCCYEPASSSSTPCTNCKSKCASTEETDTTKTCTDTTTPICCKTKGTTSTGTSTAPGYAGTTGATQVNDIGILSPIGAASLQEVVARAINTILGIVGSFALVMVIYGGIVLLTAAGKQETIKKGKDVLTWAIIGVIVVLISYMAVSFIFTAAK